MKKIINEEHKVECQICNLKFNSITANHLNKHNITVSEYKIKYPDSPINVDFRFKENPIEPIFLIENKDHVVCRLCDKKFTQLSSHLSRTHKMDGIKYKSLFPDALLTCTNISDNYRGEKSHMKNDKIKKHFSELVKGNKNPNSKESTTVLERRERSPKCIEFWMKRFPDNYQEKYQEQLEKTKLSILKNGNSPTTLQYWLNKGLNEEEAKEALKNRQATFSLEKCIEKHGEEEGTKKFLARQKKWHQNYTKSSYSMISQELFISILDLMKDEDKIKCRFATCLNGVITKDDKNWEKSVKSKNGGYLFPDFLYEKKIIEFDGTYYHKDTPENKTREQIRDAKLVEVGFDVMHVLEKDYYKDKNKVVNQCIEFLRQSNKNNNELF